MLGVISCPAVPGDLTSCCHPSNHLSVREGTPLSRLQKNLLFLVVVVILVGVAIYFIIPPSTSTRLGLDLQGGLAVILEAQDSAKAPRTDDGMTQAISIINDRINRLGVTEPEIQRQGQWKISVQLPGIENPQEALDIIGKTAVLEFYDTNQFGTPYSTEADALKAAGVESADKLPVTTRLIQWPAKADSTSDRWFLVTTEPKLTGSDLKSAKVGFDTNNQPKVDMEFKADGATKFAELTDKMAQTAQLTGQDQLLAIILDGVVQSAPRVQERIDGGRAEISGNFTLAEAKQLALVLQTGALPVELTVISQVSVGATLGKASLNQALFAGGIGFLLVIIFMIVYYRLSRPGGRHRPAHLRRALLGHPQRHRRDAHAARHRGRHPDHRHGRGRQRHHLRPCQGRGGGRQVTAHRRGGRVQEGVQRHPGCQRHHADHRRGPLLGRHRWRARVRAHAGRGCPALHVHRHHRDSIAVDGAW